MATAKTRKRQVASGVWVCLEPRGDPLLAAHVCGAARRGQRAGRLQVSIMRTRDRRISVARYMHSSSRQKP